MEKLHIKAKVVSVGMFSTSIQYWYKGKYVAYSSAFTDTFSWCSMVPEDEFPELKPLMYGSKNKVN